MFVQNNSLFRALVCCLFICCTGIVNAKNTNTINLSAPYAIALASSTKAFTEKDLNNAFASHNHRYYSVKIKSKGKVLYQLRMGFFKSTKAAQKTQKHLNLFFKKTYITKTTQSERNLSSRTEITPPSQVQLAEYLILSTTYKIADTLVDIASDSLSNLNNQATKDKSSPENVKQYDSYIAINLKTTNNLSDFDKIRKHSQIVNHAFYISELQIDGRTWYQYRLGFFIDSVPARNKLRELTDDFPLARLIRVSSAEKEDAASRIRSFFAAIPTQDVVKPLPKLPPVSKDKLKILMQQGSKALSDKKHPEAIQFFSQLLRYPENKYSMDAQEFLGFARELNGQTSYARSEYERYLSLYPESSGVNRVRQRLASLLTARSTPQKELRESKRRKGDEDWRYFGSFSQFYRKNESTLNEEDTRENLSLFSSIANLNARYRGQNYDLSSRFIGSHNLDYTGEKRKNSGSISSLYFDATNLNNHLSTKVGRQTSSKGGVLGRFDGAQFGYQVSDRIKLNAVTGFVVEETDKSANSDKFFKGINVDLGTFANAWDFNLYYIQQDDGEIIGREAVGSEIRYFHPQRTLFTLIDYDTIFKEVNTFLAIGNWRFENKTEINTTVDIRKSPFLTTSNALQGRTEQNIDELLTVLTEEQIRQLAFDQTARSTSFTLGMNNHLNDQYQLNSDITASKLTATSIAGEVIPGTDDEYYYNFQLIGNNVMIDNDSAIFGIRYSDATTAKTTSLTTNLRFPVADKWRINPRYTLSMRENVDGTDQTINNLALRFDYRWMRSVSFEMDLGGEKSDRELSASTDRTTSYFFSMGYRYDF